MDLLDRYLQAVKKHLPWQRQDDILAELRANLEAQLEDKEAGLGRPLTLGEAEDWLRQIGPPMQVAARYQPQQYLIGPALFPTYWFVLRTVFLWATIIYSIVSAVLIAFAPSGPAVLEAVLRLPFVLMQAAAWVTLIFVVLEFATTHYPGECRAIPRLLNDPTSPFGWLAGPSANWSPSSLPPLEKNPAPGKAPRSYAHAVAEVIFGFLFLVWLLLVPQYPFLLMGPGVAYLQVSPYQLAPVWVPFFWSVVALNLIQLLWNLVDLVRGSWQKPQAAQQIVTKAFGLIPLGLLLTAQDHVWIALKHPALDQLRYGSTMDSTNQAIGWGLSITCVAVVLQLLWTVVQIGLDAYRKRTEATRY